MYWLWSTIGVPSLVVEQLSSRKKGWLGFYISDDAGGDFANLKIRPAK